MIGDALSGLGVFFTADPGLRPGLSYVAPVGLSSPPTSLFAAAANLARNAATPLLKTLQGIFSKMCKPSRAATELILRQAQDD